jgi:hypothetical protein
MTAVGAVVQGKTAYLYSDTAWIDEKRGHVIAFDNKIFAGAGRFPWAAVCTMGSGLPADLQNAQMLLQQARNATSLIKLMPLVLNDFQRRSYASGVEQPGLRLVTAYWDARLKIARVSLVSNMLDGTEAFTPRGTVAHMDHHWSTDGDPADMLGRSVDFKSPASFDPDVDGLAMLQAMRCRPLVAALDGSGAEGGCGIGGEAQQAVVTKAGVQLYSLHDWGDTIGQPIDPTRALGATL